MQACCAASVREVLRVRIVRHSFALNLVAHVDGVGTAHGAAQGYEPGSVAVRAEDLGIQISMSCLDRVGFLLSFRLAAIGIDDDAPDLLTGCGCSRNVRRLCGYGGGLRRCRHRAMNRGRLGGGSRCCRRWSRTGGWLRGCGRRRERRRRGRIRGTAGGAIEVPDEAKRSDQGDDRY